MPRVPDIPRPQDESVARQDAGHDASHDASHDSHDTRRAGLCAECRHVRRTENDRGSIFYRCAYARVDSAYPKYPALPVLRCPAFTRQNAREP
jgi:hypothetical protein